MAEPTDLRTRAAEALADWRTEPYGDLRLNPERAGAKVVTAVLPDLTVPTDTPETP